MKLYTEISFGSLIKKEQELCGDKVDFLRNDEEVLLVLSDGLGSGVKANILATLTGKIIMTMMEGGADIDDVADTLAKTLPVCKERRVAYSTFTIFQITCNGFMYMVEYDNPDAVIVRNGQLWEPEKSLQIMHDKKIKESKFNLSLGDWCIAMSDGLSAAANTQLVRDYWKRENVAEFVKQKAQKNPSAFLMKKRILEECFRRYDGVIGDDSTVAVCKVQQESHIHVMIGPPLDPNDDGKIVDRFMNTYGKKVVCGGRTARIVSRETGNKLALIKREQRKSPSGKDVVTADRVMEVPPMGYMDGIDLVTEGIITVTRAVEIMRQLEPISVFEYERMAGSENGAERLVYLLMEEGTHITFFMGRANNAAHDSNKGIEFGQKVKMLEALTEELEKQNKLVKIEYC